MTNCRPRLPPAPGPRGTSRARRERGGVSTGDAARIGSARFGSGRSGSVRFGSVRLGLFRPVMGGLLSMRRAGLSNNGRAQKLRARRTTYGRHKPVGSVFIVSIAAGTRLGTRRLGPRSGTCRALLRRAVRTTAVGFGARGSNC